MSEPLPTLIFRHTFASGREITLTVTRATDTLPVTRLSTAKGLTRDERLEYLQWRFKAGELLEKIVTGGERLRMEEFTRKAIRNAQTR